MKNRITTMMLILSSISLYGNGNNTPFPKHGEEVSMSFVNKSGNDYVVFGGFTNSPVYSKNGTTNSLTWIEDLNKRGSLEIAVPMIFILSNDLILFANNTDAVEAELKKTKPNLATAISDHLNSRHTYYVLEEVVGKRREQYDAESRDTLTLSKDNTGIKAVVTNPARQALNHTLNLVKKNG